MTDPNASLGRITAFYSYKGGTGRTMLMANVAWLLAASGRHVLMVDWDLEAPGLHNYFAPFLVDPDLNASDGIIDMMVEYAAAAVEPDTEREPGWHEEYADILNYTVSIEWPFPNGGSLTLLPAGRQGGTYAARTNTFDWQRLYDELGGYGFMESVKQRMREEFTEILIDSRTGVSDTAGICTVQLPDQLVACFTLNNQSINGVSAVVRSILEQRQDGFRVFPMPTRIDNSEVDKLRERWAMARSSFAEIPLGRSSSNDSSGYWDTFQIPYIPKFSYEEVLAPIANLQGDPKSINLLTFVGEIAQRIFGVDPQTEEIPAQAREVLLDAYAGQRDRKDLGAAVRLALQAEAEREQAEDALKQRVASLERELDERRNRVQQGLGPHAFVLMPFGTKPSPDGSPVNFDAIYKELIRPALEAAGLTAIRTDEETRGGDLRIDMLQELLLADLVVADLTIDSPDVWYQLGIRHAMRSRGVVLVSGGQVTRAFDVYTDRSMRYQVRNGRPDPEALDSDREMLGSLIVSTMESWHGRKLSPLYQLIPNLVEPDWRDLRIGNLRAFWDEHDDWESRLQKARRKARIGDMLVLADEAPISVFRAQAWLRAGKALRRLGHYGFALEQLDKGLQITPTDVDGLREKGICLQRLAVRGDPAYQTEAAREHFRVMLQVNDKDAETWALLGRVEKDAWVGYWWRLPDASPEQQLDDARYEAAGLRTAIECYEKAFRLSPLHYYAGINAVILMSLYDHLTAEGRFAERANQLAAVVRLAAESEDDTTAAIWARSTLAELEILQGDPGSVERAFREAVAINRDNWFALDAIREELLLLRDLQFRPDNVNSGLAVLERALIRLPQPGREWEPRQVFLFSGHMTDAPDRPEPRFPDSSVDAASAQLTEILERLDAGPDDLALTSGAGGGDVLFTEASVARGVRMQWMQPLREPEFVLKSVVNNGEHWRQRYLAARQQLAVPVLSAPQELGDPPASVSETYPYVRCNRWLLYTALTWGVDKLHFVCLWDGSSKVPGRTGDLYEEVAKRTGQVHWIDTRSLIS